MLMLKPLKINKSIANDKHASWKASNTNGEANIERQQQTMVAKRQTQTSKSQVDLQLRFFKTKNFLK